MSNIFRMQLIELTTLPLQSNALAACIHSPYFLVLIHSITICQVKQEIWIYNKLQVEQKELENCSAIITANVLVLFIWCLIAKKAKVIDTWEWTSLLV